LVEKSTEIYPDTTSTKEEVAPAPPQVTPSFNLPTLPPLADHAKASETSNEATDAVHVDLNASPVVANTDVYLTKVPDDVAPTPSRIDEPAHAVASASFTAASAHAVSTEQSAVSNSTSVPASAVSVIKDASDNVTVTADTSSITETQRAVVPEPRQGDLLTVAPASAMLSRSVETRPIHAPEENDEEPKG
jgi:hypothetical protein